MPLRTLAPGTRVVAVPGGDLVHEVSAGSSAPVLAAHGISSHRRLWLWLREVSPELTLVAPDLRGRVDSVDVALADRVGRLGRTWDSGDAYLDYFCSSTAPLLDRDDPLLRRYVEHDLRDGRMRLSGETLAEAGS